MVFEDAERRAPAELARGRLKPEDIYTERETISCFAVKYVLIATREIIR